MFSPTGGKRISVGMDLVDLCMRDRGFRGGGGARAPPSPRSGVVRDKNNPSSRFHLPFLLLFRIANQLCECAGGSHQKGQATVQLPSGKTLFGGASPDIGVVTQQKGVARGGCPYSMLSTVNHMDKCQGTSRACSVKRRQVREDPRETNRGSGN